MIIRVVSGHFSEKLSRGEHIFVNLVTMHHEKDKKHYAFQDALGG